MRRLKDVLTIAFIVIVAILIIGGMVLAGMSLPLQ